MLDPSTASGESKSVACAEMLGQLAMLLWRFRLTTVLSGKAGAGQAAPDTSGVAANAPRAGQGSAAAAAAALRDARAHRLRGNNLAAGGAQARCDIALSFVKSEALAMLIGALRSLDTVVAAAAASDGEGDAADPDVPGDAGPSLRG